MSEEPGCPRIEADKPVRLPSGLDEPQPVVVVHRHRVGQRHAATRHSPLAHQAAYRIELAEEAAHVVHVPHRTIAGERDATATGPKIWQGEFGDAHRGGIDRGDCVSAIEVEPRAHPDIDHDPVRARAGLGHLGQAHMARHVVQVAEHVAVLQREPEVALGVEGNRVRIPGRRVGHAVARDHASADIDASDGAVAIARIPSVASAIDVDAVRIRPAVDLDARERPRRRIESGDVISFLPYEPDPAVRSHGRIARPASRPPRDGCQIPHARSQA